ncbi:hypothetical protein B0H14DRAFT_3877250, partial [Mycena olivaceomarginata]
MTARELARLVRDWQRDVTSTVTWRTTFVVVDAACSERIKREHTLLHTCLTTALHESPQPSLELPSFLALALTPGSLVPRLAYHRCTPSKSRS